MLPPQFEDLTWVEAICACWQSHNHILQVYGSANNRAASRLQGNVCLLQQKTTSVAKVIPVIPSNLTGMISMAFVGSKIPDKLPLDRIMQVRKAKVVAFMQWLKENNLLYHNIVLLEEAASMYPNDGMPQELFVVMDRDVGT